MDRKKKETLVRMMECAICLEVLEDPRLLSCGHRLCYTCVKKYTDKGKYGDQLPCPQCRQTTQLYEGGVDNLTKCFFTQDLKDVLLTMDSLVEGKLQPRVQSESVCSTPDCRGSAVKYCRQEGQFMCQQCYGEHQSIKMTRTHQVIPASEAESVTKPKMPVYPRCHSHRRQVMDLYCRTCNIPICSTCYHEHHSSHNHCHLDEHADVCKTKLLEIGVKTDQLIKFVEKTMDKTKCNILQANADIKQMCDTVKSTFRTLHKKLEKEEKTIMEDLKGKHKRVQEVTDAITESQSSILADLERMKCCQVKLADKGNNYDYVTVTDSMGRDVAEQVSSELAGFSWKFDFERGCKTLTFGDPSQVQMKETHLVSNTVQGGSKIVLHGQDTGKVIGMVVYKQHIYVVHLQRLIVYCYAPDGSLVEVYEHGDSLNTVIHGMCLMMTEATPFLVVSDYLNQNLVWVSINDDLTMTKHHTQHLEYKPRGSNADANRLMVCDGENHKIHRYGPGGQALSVLRLPGDVNPSRVSRYTAPNGRNRYIVTDWDNKQVVVIGKRGEVMKRYRNNIHGVKLLKPSDVITDIQGRILISDHTQEQLLLLSTEEQQVKKLIQQKELRHPYRIFLDTDHGKLYVSGEDEGDIDCVFVYGYINYTGDRILKENITQLNMTVQKITYFT